MVVAVLLDNFIHATELEKISVKYRQRQQAMETRAHHPLAPLLRRLVDSVDTEKELVGAMQTIFRVLDVDDFGAVTFSQMRDGLRKLHLSPRVNLTEEDFENITESGELCDAFGRVPLSSFTAMLYRQLHAFTQRHVSDAAAVCQAHGDTEAILQVPCPLPPLALALALARSVSLFLCPRSVNLSSVSSLARSRGGAFAGPSGKGSQRDRPR